jgi:hypothetical protein
MIDNPSSLGDKGRAIKAGTLGFYYRSLPDRRRLPRSLDIDSNAFREIADRALDDQAVLRQLTDIGASAERLIGFGPARR